jgi:hypothetical protein
VHVLSPGQKVAIWQDRAASPAGGGMAAVAASQAKTIATGGR